MQISRIPTSQKPKDITLDTELWSVFNIPLYTSFKFDNGLKSTNLTPVEEFFEFLGVT